MKNIIRNMVLAAGVFGMTACSDFLDQPYGPTDNVTAQVFDNVEQSQLAVNKLYGYLTDATYGQYVPIIMGTGTDCELIDGLGTESLNTTSERGNMNYNYSPAWTTLNNCWNGMYAIINDANVMLEGIEASNLFKSGNADMKRLYGEVLTIRAMVYLDLTRMWGDVPFATDSDPKSENLYRSKTDRDVIQDACIADLQKAVPMLPWIGENGTTVERVTKGYALGLLAQTALTRAGYSIREKAKDGYENLPTYSDDTYPTQRPGAEERAKYYKIAADACAEIIVSKKHDLNDSFEDYWKAINQLTFDPKHESMFEIANGCGVTGELGYTVGKRINGATTAFGGKGNSSGKLKLTGQLWQTFHSTGNTGSTETAYQSLDKRRDVTFALFQFKQATGFKYYDVTHNEELFYDDKQVTGPFAFYCGKWNPEWWTEKLQTVAHNANDAKWATGINVVRMRYPQILLMYAEATYQLFGNAVTAYNGGPFAIEALEWVHKRAYEDKAAGEAFIRQLAEQDFMEALYAENAWEFAGEGVRKWELIRWGQLSQKIVEAKQQFVDGVVKQPSQGGYPRFMFYQLVEKTVGGQKFLAADPASFCWNGMEVYPLKDANKRHDKKTYMSQKWFAHADNGMSETTMKTNLPTICDGLNPWSALGVDKYSNRDLFKTQTNTTVKNRYILPIGALTISASNGTLQNSYGY